MKSNIVLKIIISAALLWLVLSHIDLCQVASVIQKADLIWVFWALGFNMLIVIVGVFRLRLLLTAKSNQRVSFLSLLEIYWIGMFFNLFLPSQVGGDIVKAYKLSKRSKQANDSVAAVVMDRIIGLTSMVFVAGLALVFGRYSLNVSVAWKAIMCALLICVAFYYFIFNKKAMNKMQFMVQWLKWLKINDLARDIYFSFNAYQDRFNVLGYAFLISIAFNSMGFIGGYFLARAVGVDLPLVYFFILLPLISVITLVPVSISGIGLQEGAYVFFFSQLGVDPAKALGISILSHILRFGVGAIGGLIYLNEK